MDVHILIPVYNDWASVSHLLEELSDICKDRPESVAVTLIDDGSTAESGFDSERIGRLDGLVALDVIELTVNVGHARAIAIGMSALTAEKSGDVLIVMDGDGEDKPSDVPRMLDRFAEKPGFVIVAQREQRSESMTFRFFYQIYKWFFRIMTGRSITFGNFCLCPWPVARKLSYMPELLSHLAGSLLRSHFKIDRLSTDRGARYAGQSKMRFTSLLQHGLGSIAVDLDPVLIRLLIGLSAFIGLLFLGLIGITSIRFFSEIAIPGWATTSFGLVAVLLTQSVVFAVLLLFISLKTRHLMQMIPAYCYKDYINSCVSIYPGRDS